MSSFRIDRQYVAFETAETQPVYATKPQKTTQASDDETNAYSQDVSKLYNEIYERLLKEHAEQAEFMLSKAADEAADIVEKAKKQADEMIGRATSDAARMKDELKREMEEASSERKNRAETELITLETQLRNDYTSRVDAMHGDVIGLVMEIVRKIIGIKLSQSDDVFMGMIRDALEQLKQTGSAVIRVSPVDYARYFSRERDEQGNVSINEALDTGEIKLTVVEEPNFKAGDLIVESEGEMIDLSIDRQIDLIEKAFLN